MEISLYKPRLSYLLFFFVFINGFFSCVDKNEEYGSTTFDRKQRAAASTLDYNLINQLYESNQRIIEITSYLFNQTQEIKTLQLILKIKNDHLKLDFEIKKLTEKNLILIPKLDFYLNNKTNFLKLKKSNSNLLTVVETELSNQITLLNQIQKSTQNSDFKIFAEQSIQSITTNKEELNKTP